MKAVSVTAFLIVAAAFAAVPATADAVVTAGASPTVTISAATAWKNYKRKYLHDDEGKKRWDDSKDASHKATYLKNMAEFAKVNPYTTSEVGETPFTHMSSEEFSDFVAKSGIRGQPLPSADLTSINTGKKVGATLAPTTFDWRNYPNSTVVLPVGNQGSCGSCWAATASSTLYACQAIKKSPTAALPSTQQLVDCSDSYGNTGCSGGWAHKAFNYVKGNKGVNIAANYPYVGVDKACDTTLARTKIMTISSYVTLPVNDPVSMMSAVLINPLAVTLRASEYIFQHYTGGIISNATACGTAYDHQMMVVGYNTDAATGLDYWIAKNTWGTSWGDLGYVYIQRDSTSGIGMCGINQYTVYPTC